MCHQIISVGYRSAATEWVEIWGHVYIGQWSTKQESSPWSYQRPGLESLYGAVACRHTSLASEHYSYSHADLCLRKESCWAFITSGTGPQECCYPASGHWPASSCSMSLTHPLPFWLWGNSGRASQASLPKFGGLTEELGS